MIEKHTQKLFVFWLSGAIVKELLVCLGCCLVSEVSGKTVDKAVYCGGVVCSATAAVSYAP